MLTRGFWTLVWVETKIFVREPLGVVAAVVVPLAVLLGLGGLVAEGEAGEDSAALTVEVPVFAILILVVSAVVSIVAIISIYRETGVLKRLRATPLRSPTLFAAHVVVKLSFTIATLLVMLAAGHRVLPAGLDVPLIDVTLAVAFVTAALMAVGFLIASLVPTARFAQPLASLMLYPMIGVSGLFVPIDELPGIVQPVARLLPLTPAVSLLRGIWTGGAWSAHGGDVALLVGVFVAATTLAARTFRWE